MIKAIERFGTISDGIRALRPGGPLDSLSYSTHCAVCERIACEPIRWFHEREFLCGCGGRFDGTAIERFIAALAAGDVPLALSIHEIKPIDQNPEGDA